MKKISNLMKVLIKKVGFTKKFLTINITVMLLFLSIVLVMSNNSYSQNGARIVDSVQIKINPTKVDLKFEGIGAVSAGASSRLLIDYPEPMRSHILDFLFKPKYGAGFQHLKVEIGGDVNSTDGTEPSYMRKRGEENFKRGYEWWLMKEARKRNPNIILDALAWGAPGWIGNGKFYSKDGADYIASFLLGAKKIYNLDINYVGIWNERNFEGSWIKLLRKTLDEKGLQNVKIVANDLEWEIADSMAIDKGLEKAVYAIGVHYPKGTTPIPALELQMKKGKHLWSSEDGYWDLKNPFAFLYRVPRCNLNFIERHLTKTEFWSPVTSYYDCLPAPNSGVIKANTPWSGAFEIEPATWYVAHTTQFAQPGWFYIRGANIKLPKGGSLVSLTSPDRKDISIIIETVDAKVVQVVQKVIIKPEDINISSLHVWRTNYYQEMALFVQDNDLKAKNGEFTILVKPNTIYSLTTTTGQQKGSASSPPPKAFPLPYYENFDSYQTGATPKYLSDFGGAFEVVKRKSGGMCLRQVIDQKGIEWATVPSAYSYIGDVNWNDIEVSVDASLDSVPSDSSRLRKRFLEVIARSCMVSFARFSYVNPVGYSLRLYGDGLWKLFAADKQIAGGQTIKPGTGWHNLKLSCKQDRIKATIDGKVLAEIIDHTYTKGLVGIGCDFQPALFDNLKIEGK